MVAVSRALVVPLRSQEEWEEILHKERETKKEEEIFAPIKANQQNKKVDREKEQESTVNISQSTPSPKLISQLDKLRYLQEMYKQHLKQKELKRKNTTSMSNKIHCYRISMIVEAQKQPQVTRRTATIVTFATTPPEAQLYLKIKPTETDTQGNTGATVDGNKSILKRTIPAGPKITVPAQVEQAKSVPKVQSAPSYASLFSELRAPHASPITRWCVHRHKRRCAPRAIPKIIAPA